MSRPVCSKEQEYDRDGYRDNGEAEFDVAGIDNYHQELCSKSQEEEEVEFEQSDVNLS